MSDTYLSLFSGIGGLDLGLDRAGWRCVGQVEREPFCRAVLTKHWPEVPKHDDVRTAVEWWRGRPRPAVRLVAGGYPCPGESLSGLRLGADDPRWLWPAMVAVVAALRPEWVVGENVLGHRTKGLPTVLADLARLGYAARAGVIRACEVGAPHSRARLFVLAHAASGGRTPWSTEPGREGSAAGEGPAAEPARCGRWATEPRVGRVAHGVPDRVDRVTALGNAVVPAVGEHIGRLILAADRAAVA